MVTFLAISLTAKCDKMVFVEIEWKSSRYLFKKGTAINRNSQSNETLIVIRGEYITISYQPFGAHFHFLSEILIITFGRGEVI